MKRLCLFRLLSAIVLVSLACPAQLPACSAFSFSLQGNVFAAKSYDWDVDDALLVVNPRGLRKTALTPVDPAAWMARYGSVTFNQYGREFPNGGMNEKGLVIEVLWLSETVYPAPDQRPALQAAQWVQYHLDCCADVQEALASDAFIRIESGGLQPTLPFFLADAAGQTAAVEWVEGRRVVHSGPTMPVQALANSTYPELLENTPDGPRLSAAAMAGLTGRFGRMASGLAALAALRREEAVPSAFALLDQVRQGTFTKWNIVYDIQGRTVHFRTQRNPQIRSLALASCHFECSSPSRSLDLNGPGQGDIAAAMTDWTLLQNCALVRKTFTSTGFLKGTPPLAIEMIANYPAFIQCEPGARPGGTSEGAVSGSR